jgi:hypothetical protein
LAILVVASCSGKPALVGPGGVCSLATDCQEGLVCVPHDDGTRTCDSDLKGVVPDQGGGPVQDSGSGQGGRDSASSDAPPPNDSYVPPDTSTATDSSLADAGGAG